MVKEIVRVVKLSAKPGNTTRSYLLESAVLRLQMPESGTLMLAPLLLTGAGHWLTRRALP
jgi:hypothetical protein